jgi:hypothetical protein
MEVVHRFPLSDRTEMVAGLNREDGTYWLEFKEVAAGGEPQSAPCTLRLPLAQLPELKRALGRVEDRVSGEGLLEDYESQADYQRAQAQRFANESEAEFAQLLNFYHIRWRYEPQTFPITWDEAGNVIESFTPDFFLEDYHLFIELTTLKQSLVTRKNRKVRRFKEIYPQYPIRIFYGRDYRSLLQKYGLAAPESEP